MSTVHGFAFRIGFAAALCFATVMEQSASAGNLAFNGGFETGSFSGWNVPAPMSMQNQFTVNQLGGPHSGTYYAQLSSSSLQFVSQTLPTQAGQDYELSFWLRKTSTFPGGLMVRWEGSPIFSQLLFGPEDLTWRQFTLPVHANITGSFLEFGQAYFPEEFHIDDISVVPVPAPSAAAVLVTGGAMAAMRRRRR